MSNLIENGSFETASCPPGGQSWCLYPAANVSSVIPPWTMVEGTQVEIDTASTYPFAPTQGNVTMDLVANGPSAIGQTIQTIPGAIYAVSFQLNRNPYCDNGTKTGFVSLGKMEKAFEHSGDKWILQSFNFTATNTSSLFVIGSRQQGNSCGPVIDDVQLVKKSDPPVVKMPVTTSATTFAAVTSSSSSSTFAAVTSSSVTTSTTSFTLAPAGYSTNAPLITSSTISTAALATKTAAPVEIVSEKGQGYKSVDYVDKKGQGYKSVDYVDNADNVDAILSNDLAASINLVVFIIPLLFLV